MHNDAKIIDSVMCEFFHERRYFIMLLKHAVMEKIGASTESTRIDFPEWSDPGEYYHFKGVKIVEFDTISDLEDVVLVSQKEFLEICLYYIGEFKKAYPEEKDPLIPLAEEKIKKDLTTMQ